MNILVIFTGGTIGSTKTNGIISPDSSSRFNLIELYNSQGFRNVNFSTAVPYTLLSENLNGDYWNLLYDLIYKNINLYDGIIVTHGTDTLQYTSAFLSYCFDSFTTPIVVVSANYPLTDKKSNGLSNFTSAIDFIAQSKTGGVFVAYKNKKENAKIHKPINLLPHLPYDDCIYSIKNNFYGEIVNGIFHKNNNYQYTEMDFYKSEIPKISELSPILKVSPYVGMTYPEITENIKAILLESYHSGTINTKDNNLKIICRLAKNKNIPVYLIGSEKGFFYESKLLFDDLNIEILPPISPIYAYIKLWIEYTS